VHGRTVKIRCTVLCYGCKYIIEYLIWKKRENLKKNFNNCSLIIVLFRKMHGRTVKISCNVLCYGWKYRLFNIEKKVKIKKKINSCSLIIVFIYKDAR